MIVSNLKRLILAAGFVFYLFSGLLRIGLVITFALGIVRWNLSPWWSWPIAALVAVMLSRAGKRLMDSSEEKRSPRDSGHVTFRKLAS
jgi:hypothetical protein